jgi:hypothetical protein
VVPRRSLRGFSASCSFQDLLSLNPKQSLKSQRRQRKPHRNRRETSFCIPRCIAGIAPDKIPLRASNHLDPLYFLWLCIHGNRAAALTTDHKSKVNMLNVCTPSATSRRRLWPLWARIPKQPLFSQDFEVDRGRSTLDETRTFCRARPQRRHRLNLRSPAGCVSAASSACRRSFLLCSIRSAPTE